MKLANVTATFPPGTTVGAYRSAHFDAGEPSPVGPQLDTAVVALDGSLTFSGLVEDGTTYAAAGIVESAWRVMRFTTPAPPPNLGPVGPQGPRGSSVLSGEGAPEPTDGEDGDFWIDTAASEMYGPKEAGEWGPGTSLVGPQGNMGFTYKFLTDTAETAPGNGALKLNKVFGLSTKMYISTHSLLGELLTGEVPGWGGSSSVTKAKVILRKKSAPNTFYALWITSEFTAKEENSWGVYSVLPITNNFNLVDGDEVIVEVMRVGDKGSEGAQGKEGKEGKQGPQGNEGEVSKAELEEHLPGHLTPVVENEEFTPSVKNCMHVFGGKIQTIKKITATVTGHIIILFQATSFELIVKNENNLRLAGANANLNLRDALVLVCNGGDWIELSRSLNS